MRIGNIICLMLGGLALISLGCSSAREEKLTSYAGQQQKAKAPDRQATAATAPATPKLPAPSPLQKLDPANAHATMVEEIWIVEKQQEWVPGDHHPGPGELLVQRKTRPVILAATAIDIDAKIVGFAAMVEVRQRFHNPYHQKLQASYLFPLPAGAAITDFILTIGQRHIRGMIRERQEAEAIYAAARKQGYRAAFISREGGKLFGQKLANIAPGQEIEVKIAYFHSLAYRDGAFHFVFPLKIASGQGRHRQATPSPAVASVIRRLTVDIEAGVALGDIACRHHPITIARPSASRAIVTLRQPQQPIAQNFQLSYRLTSKAQAALIMPPTPHRGTIFALIVQPGARSFLRPEMAWGDWRVSAVRPDRLSQMSGPQPMMLCGCLISTGKSRINVTGIGSAHQSLRLPVTIVCGSYPAIEKLWAQRQIQHLSRPGLSPPTRRQIIDLSLRYGLLCDDTAFIVVDSLTTEK